MAVFYITLSPPRAIEPHPFFPLRNDLIVHFFVSAGRAS